MIRVLGPLRVGAAERPVKGQLGRLLALLAIQVDQVVPSAKLAGSVLSDLRQDDQASLYVLVSRLRRLLREELPEAVLVSEGAGYRLGSVAVDASEFVELTRHATGHRAAHRERLERALALWRGRAADGLGLDDHPLVLRLEDWRLTTVEDLLANGLLADGSREELDERVRDCRLHPERERLASLAALALYRGGRPGDALDLLTEVRTFLGTERGLEPGPTLISIESAILRHDTAAIDARIAELAGDEMAADRVGTPSDGARNLPTPLTSFIGRENERAEVAAALRASRIVTVVGPGGIGKTRLANEVARDWNGPDMVRWCELAPVRDPEAVPRTIAASFNVISDGSRSLLDTLAGFLAPRPVLLVLDNCEHLIDVAADIVADLCERCPHLTVLATSREPLDLAGERTVTLPPLEIDTAVQLFTERARAVQPSFGADRDTEQICRALDGMPLALEMAAARIRSMQPAEMVARLDQRFQLLLGPRGTASRHQTLHATVGWSHDLLNDRDRRVFRRLSVFAGTFDLAAAEAVTTADELSVVDVDNALHSLVSKSLVVGAGHERMTRYSLLETFRAYASERLQDAGERDDISRRHAGHYAGLVAEAGIGLRGPAETEWADRIDLELGNLRAAFGWALEVAEAELALALFAPLPASSLAQTTAHEMFDWIDPALDLPGAAHSTHVSTALTWVNLRTSDLQQHESTAARLRWIQQHRPELNTGRDPAVAALAAMSAHATGRLAEAAAFHRTAASLFAERGDEYQAIRSEALVLWCQPNDDIAPDLERLAERARALANPFMTAFGLGIACAPRNVLRDPAAALRYLDEAALWGARSRNPFLYRAIQGARVLALTLLGEPDALATARELVIESRNLNQIGVAIGALSVAFAIVGRHDEAAELIGAASRTPTVYAQLDASPRVQAVWAATRAALGEAGYEAALRRGASRSYDDLVSWLTG